ncbi:hypothetical protein NFI95_10680 [Acetobacteraceae bacterium KSS8]|uniref:Transposase n=1 Tax=Endosaccharibacter trunci TaxID=2812733 RepID=A0ABT1WAR6_9PROT|nr:hypothetical protein [Acetobacteraceae bacterium KSS8]
MSDPDWLSDEAWAALEPHMPKNRPGAPRVNARPAIARARAVGRDHPFKKTNDEETKRALPVELPDGCPT